MGERQQLPPGGSVAGAVNFRAPLHYLSSVEMPLPITPTGISKLSMTHISIRDLQRISGEAIGALPGPALVKSGDRTVGLLITLKAANPDHLTDVLARAASLAVDRDTAADEAALADMGIDPTDWSVAAVRALVASHR